MLCALPPSVCIRQPPPPPPPPIRESTSRERHTVLQVQTRPISQRPPQTPLPGALSLVCLARLHPRTNIHSIGSTSDEAVYISLRAFPPLPTSPETTPLRATPYTYHPLPRAPGATVRPFDGRQT
nr:hypothetical protein CFP56_09970 [Quercus suber]